MEVKKQAIFIVISLIYILHISMTVLFLLPPNPSTNFYSRAVNTYMIPLFAQEWMLFAPEPPIADRYLWYRCRSSNEWSEWQEPGNAILSGLKFNPVGYQHKLYASYNKLVIALLREFSEKKADSSPNHMLTKTDSDSTIVKLVSRFAGTLCENEHKDFEALQYKAVTVLIKPYSKRFKPPEKDLGWIDFPIVMRSEI